MPSIALDSQASGYITIPATARNHSLTVTADGDCSVDVQPSADGQTVRSPIGGLRGFTRGVEQTIALELSQTDRAVRVTVQNESHRPVNITLDVV